MLTALPDPLSDDVRADTAAALAADPLPTRAYEAALGLTLDHSDPDTLAAALVDELGIPPGALTAAGRRSRVAKSFDENRWVKNLRSSARSIATAAEGRAMQYTLSRAGVPEKQWISRHDHKTRPTHLAADGQTVPTEQPFLVGGFPLMHPGDTTTAPLEETANCRCVMRGILAEFGDDIPVRRSDLPKPGVDTYSHAIEVHTPGTGSPNKTEFPWTDPHEIATAIADVTDHGQARMRGNKLIIEGDHRGYTIRVVYDTYGGKAKFRSAYPPPQSGPPGGQPIQRNPSHSGRRR